MDPKAAIIHKKFETNSNSDVKKHTIYENLKERKIWSHIRKS